MKNWVKNNWRNIWLFSLLTISMILVGIVFAVLATTGTTWGTWVAAITTGVILLAQFITVIKIIKGGKDNE